MSRWSLFGVGILVLVSMLVVGCGEMGQLPLLGGWGEELGQEKPLRTTVDLSGGGWKLWRDKQAKWQTETLYVPPVDLAKVEVHPPTVGWDKLDASAEREVKVPGTVEEYLWGADDPNNSYNTGGNYQGVSFWWREFTVPTEMAGKRLVLRFEACRLRAEVFVNETLVGYDLVGNMPFEVDVSKAVKPGQTNRLTVRITDPNDNNTDNNFDYGDFRSMPWGGVEGGPRVPPGRGFGGITGKVTLLGLEPVYVEDVFVRNKPSPSAEKPTDVDVEVSLANTTEQEQRVALTLKIRERVKGKDGAFRSGKAIHMEAWDNMPVGGGVTRITKNITARDVKLWSLESPNLYDCEVVVADASGAGKDGVKATFGYRWFGPDGWEGENPVLRLNGKRVFVKSAISWGYWPINGLIPSAELAERQTRAAKELGLNMLNMHRCSPDPALLEKADEMGLLIYNEPGSYKCDKGDATARALATEKLLRFVKRDRNHPSVVIWAMINEIWVREDIVHPEYLRDMESIRKLDPSRTIVLASGQARGNWTTTGNPRGSWYPPYTEKRWESHWYDEHHAGSDGVYLDHKYNNPESYAFLGTGNKPGLGYLGIIYLGEEGAISSPPQLGAMRADYAKRGLKGWDGMDYERYFQNYSQWLEAHGGRGSFASLDDLCRSIGNIAYYYHGKMIENCRISDKIDAYVINGWECTKMDNHSGIVDPFRRFKGNADILRYYTQPLYVAVKARRKVVEPGSDVLCDFFLINEKDVKGEHTLEALVTDAAGKDLFRESFPVAAQGGETYGQLLKRDVTVKTGDMTGYVKISARLLNKENQEVARGVDEVLVVDYTSLPIPPGGVVLNGAGPVRRFLKTLNYDAVPLEKAEGSVPFIVVGTEDPGSLGGQVDDLLERVRRDGTTLVLLHQPERWAETLAKREIWRYEGVLPVGSQWIGGGFFALRSPLLDGIPQAMGLNWEHQILASNHQPAPGRRGLLVSGDEAAIGAFSYSNGHNPRLASALGFVRYGKGRIVFSTFPLMQHVTQSSSTSAVSKRVVINALRLGTMP